MFQPVSSDPDLVRREERILSFWREFDIFAESLRRREEASEWVFYEGPPTANARPGIHHVWARIFKDLYPRYQTMRGHYVSRKAGWDCHGLPVELEVEKELGIEHKAQIEELGIEEFNRRCRESVTRYVEDWADLTERIGFWIDLDEAYWTMDPGYVETVWWNLKQMWDQDLLYEGHKVVPYCPRCGTALSDHEVAQGYSRTTDPSVFVRFPLEDPPWDLLVWTTTPWTLFSNTGVAVHPEEEYAVVDIDGGRPVIMAAATVERVFGEGTPVLERVPAHRLAGLGYRRPFEDLDLDGSPRVVADPFVTTDEGTGVVHLAPAFGQIDMEIGEREGLAFVNPVGPDGTFQEGPWEGVFVKTADPDIIEELRSRRLLVKSEEYVHTYPFCWRCDTPLLYWAKGSWFIRTSARKEDLLRANDEISWYPDHIKEGRFGDWLANNVDWALSRDRYWGTPLPVWRCEEGHDTCIGSFAELSSLSGRHLSGFDPHRPHVDRITITCPECGGEAQRLPPVIDAWFDSGSMPDAQWHHPFENREVFERRFPAQFIAEAIDQTRGWFYSLLAVSTLLWGRSSYETVLCLGHIVDREGRKMSKSRGNVIDPPAILDAQGADALRWNMFTSGSPWTNQRVYPEAIEESTRRVLLTLWNTFSFFVTYASLDRWAPAAGSPPVGNRPVLDRWILSRLDGVIAGTTLALDDFDAQRAGRTLEEFIDDLSNWYVRRARPRFWRSVRGGGPARDPNKAAAHATLYTCLLALSRLMAPFVPFLAEELYQNLSGHHFRHQESVHFESWPEPFGNRDETLEDEMAFARRVVTLGRSARTDAKVKTRQPLPRLVLSGRRSLEGELLEEVLSELNVKGLEVGSVEEARSHVLKPDFSRLGPRLGPKVQELQAVLEAAEAATMARQLTEEGHLILDLGGEQVRLEPEDLEVRVESAPGWAVAEDPQLTVALDLALDEDLRAEGWLRELTHHLQNARKEAGLAVDDRIDLRLVAPAERGGLIRDHARQLSRDLLAVQLEVRDGEPRGETIEVMGVPVEVELERAAD